MQKNMTVRRIICSMVINVLRSMIIYFPGTERLPGEVM